MIPGSSAENSPPRAESGPSAADVLRWCANQRPGLWFPSVHARDAGISRDSLDEPLMLLRQAGLVQVADWVRGVGQGYSLTPAGEKVVADPAAPIVIRPDAPPLEDIPPEDADLAHIPNPALTPPPRVPGITAYDRGELTREAFLAPRPAILTPILLIVNMAWFVVGIITAWRMGVPYGQYLRGQSVEVLRRIGAANGPDLLAGEWWRLFLCGIVHIGGIHLIVNLFALALIGPVAEGLWGRWRFMALYLIAGVAAGCTAVAMNPMSAIAGASGSLWGVQLAVVAWLLRYREHLPPDVVSSWLRRLFLVIAINMVLSFLPGVSWEGHLGGALAGFFGAIFLDFTRPGASSRQYVLGVLGILGTLMLMCGGLLTTIRYSPEWAAMRESRKNPDRATREAMMKEAAEIVDSVSPERVKAVHAQVTAALILCNREQILSARETVARLKTNSQRATERTLPQTEGIPAKFRAYLTELNRFIEIAEERLDVARVPNAEEWIALADQRAKMEQAWGVIPEKPN